MTASQISNQVANQAVDFDALGDEIARTFTAIDQATHRALAMLRAFDAGGGWASSGATSCAAWLSWRTGLTPGPARERLRVAHKLAELPLIDAAFAAGELSYSKVRALTRIADADSEAILLDDARLMTGAELERLVRHLRRAKIAEATTEGYGDADSDCDSGPERFFRQRTTDEGMVQITVQLTADEAAVVTAALDASAKTRRAEALVAMADERLRGNAPNRSAAEVSIHIDANSLEGEVAGTTAEGDLLGAETCRRLLCDAGVVPVLEDGRGETLDVGRKSRTIPAAIKRAMAIRDGGRCRFPGCDNQIVDGHHVKHWAEGGTTCLDNVISLCRRHHRFVHEGGGSVVAAGDGFGFRDRRGRLIEAAPEPPAAPPLETGAGDPWRACAKNDSWSSIDWPYLIGVQSGLLGWDEPGPRGRRRPTR